MSDNNSDSKRILDQAGRPFERSETPVSTVKSAFTFTKAQLATTLAALGLVAAALGNVDRILTFFFPDPTVTYLSISPDTLPIKDTSLAELVKNIGIDPEKPRQVLIIGSNDAPDDENALSVYVAFNIENVGSHEARDVELTVDFALRRNEHENERLIPIQQTFELGTIPPGKVFYHDAIFSVIGKADTLPANEVARFFEDGQILAIVSCTATYVNNLGNRVDSGEFQGQGSAGFLQRVYQRAWGPSEHPSQQK